MPTDIGAIALSLVASGGSFMEPAPPGADLSAQVPVEHDLDVDLAISGE